MGLNTREETKMKTPELIASILKEGGKLLLVGGTTSDLPREYQEHPQIVIWDDEKMGGGSNREVPINTKIIMWNRWISHETQRKLNDAARSLRALKFPLLRTREIKELLSEVVQAEPMELSHEELEKEIETVNEIVDSNAEVTDLAPKKKLSLVEFIAKHMSLTADYTVRGMIAKEGKRIYQRAKDDGFKTTESSVVQALGKTLRDMKRNKSVPPKAVSKERATVDDFSELERLIDDAITAMKLVQEHLPKVRKETERLRGLKEKMLKLLD